MLASTCGGYFEQGHTALQAPQPVTIRVGEREFHTTERVLTKESRYFSRRLDTHFEREENNTYFVDRDPDLFEHVFYFLRTGMMPVIMRPDQTTDKSGYAKLLAEARFYEIGQLVRWIEHWDLVSSDMMSIYLK